MNTATLHLPILTMSSIHNLDMMYSLTIAGVRLFIQSDREIKVNKAFEPFLFSLSSNLQDSFDYHITIQTVSSLSPAGVPQKISEDYFEFSVNGQIERLYFDRRSKDHPYLLAKYNWTGRSIILSVLPEGKEYICEFSNLFFHLALEQIFYRESKFYLHAVFIQTMDGALLFSGPSGVGKTTLSRYWIQQFGGDVLNGDRTILEWKENHLIGWVVMIL